MATEQEWESVLQIKTSGRDDSRDVYKRQILLPPASMEIAMPMAGLPL